MQILYNYRRIDWGGWVIIFQQYHVRSQIYNVPTEMVKCIYCVRKYKTNHYTYLIIECLLFIVYKLSMNYNIIYYIYFSLIFIQIRKYLKNKFYINLFI